MKKGVIVGFISIVILSIIIVFLYAKSSSDAIVSPIGKEKEEKPLDIYSYSRLKQITFHPSTIIIGKQVNSGVGFTSSLFTFTIDDVPLLGKTKKVTGLINMPKDSGTYPVIVMFRGFVPKEIYTTGEGTRRAGEMFAKNGFITLAPDFLGYGESDNPSMSAIEERFQTYTTALTLLSSVQNLNRVLTATSGAQIKADVNKIGIWGHSNGGQIALSVLEITGKPYPTVLWAPVSKPFPYSILYFTDEFDDHGKALRQVVADFDKEYDAEKYSPSNFYDWITAPISLHQGGNDDAVPLRWSNELAENLKKLNKEITYFTYPGDDHNLSPTGWSTAVDRSSRFYKNYLQ